MEKGARLAPAPVCSYLSTLTKAVKLLSSFTGETPVRLHSVRPGREDGGTDPYSGA